jgi:hypothetical protein
MESCCLFLKQKDYSFLPPPLLLLLLFLFASKRSKTTSRFHNTPFWTQRPQFLWRWQILLFVFFCWENRRDLYRSPPRLHWPISFNSITPYAGAYVAIFSSHLPSPIVSAIYWLTLRHCIVHRLEHPQFCFCCPESRIHLLPLTSIHQPPFFDCGPAARRLSRVPRIARYLHPLPFCVVPRSGDGDGDVHEAW